MKKTTPIAAFGAVAVLAFTGCSGSAEEPAEESAPESSSAPSEEAQPEIAALPVGEPFGAPQWSIDIGQDELVVTPDRLIGIGVERIRAWSAEGEEVWSYDHGGATVWVGSETVAIGELGESEASGLDKSQPIVAITLLSLAGGEEVATAEVANPGVIGAGSGLAVRIDDYSGFVVIFEDGTTQKIETSLSRADTFGQVGGIPFWFNASEIQTEQWNSRDLDLGASGVEMVDQALGLLLLSNTSGRGVDPDALAMVDAAAGEVLYTVSCPTNEYGFGASGGNNGNTARNSPNGEYGVAARLLYSSETSQCVGGGEQQNVSLTAVDDNGTAYGRSEEGDLVVVPFGGEPEVSAFPSGAMPPVGVMTGNLAIHWISGTVTGNPITG